MVVRVCHLYRHARPVSGDISCLFQMYTKLQKKRRNFNSSIRYEKQSIYFFSLDNRFLFQHKVLVLITKS